MSAFESHRPRSDRELYYQLVAAFTAEQRRIASQPIEFYEALLYWKLYSQHVTASNLSRWLRRDPLSRERIAERVQLLFNALPSDLERTPTALIEAVKSLGTYGIPGIGKSKSDALPVRTTLLHFLYPSTVPVFDKMVLKATGLWHPNANMQLPVLEQYLTVAWSLADRYADQASILKNETPVRAVDMALWVIRGGCNESHV